MKAPTLSQILLGFKVLLKSCAFLLLSLRILLSILLEVSLPLCIIVESVHTLHPLFSSCYLLGLPGRPGNRQKGYRQRYGTPGNFGVTLTSVLKVRRVALGITGKIYDKTLSYWQF